MGDARGRMPPGVVLQKSDPSKAKGEGLLVGRVVAWTRLPLKQGASLLSFAINHIMQGNSVFSVGTTKPVYWRSGAGSTLEIFGQHQNAHLASSSVSVTPTKASFVTSEAQSLGLRFFLQSRLLTSKCPQLSALPLIQGELNFLRNLL